MVYSIYLILLKLSNTPTPSFSSISVTTPQLYSTQYPIIWLLIFWKGNQLYILLLACTLIIYNSIYLGQSKPNLIYMFFLIWYILLNQIIHNIFMTFNFINDQHSLIDFDCKNINYFEWSGPGVTLKICVMNSEQHFVLL